MMQCKWDQRFFLKKMRSEPILAYIVLRPCQLFWRPTKSPNLLHCSSLLNAELMELQGGVIVLPCQPAASECWYKVSMFKRWHTKAIYKPDNISHYTETAKPDDYHAGFVLTSPPPSTVLNFKRHHIFTMLAFSVFVESDRTVKYHAGSWLCAVLAWCPFSASYIGPNWAGLFSVIVVGFWQASAKQDVIIYGTHQIWPACCWCRVFCTT